MIPAVSLDDRGVVAVEGADAAPFLHGLVTNDILALAPGKARFSALLSPQGKILFDFLIFARGADGARAFLLDVPLALVESLVRRLETYKLRAHVTIADRSADFASLAFPSAAEKPKIEALLLARDPRSPRLGWRALIERGALAGLTFAGREDYDAKRIAAGAPEGVVDFAYGETFPHEANMDRLNGLDFEKGCFVGQEVVSRMKHRGGPRKRILRYRARGLAPAPGTPVAADGLELGVTGSRSGESGLATIRLDRLEEARAAGLAPRAGGAALEFAVEA